MRKLWILLNIVIFAILVFVLIQPQLRARRIKEITIIYDKSVNSLPLFVAMENGYFDSLKLKVTLQETEKLGEEVERVGRGAMGAGFGTTWDLFALKASGSPEIFRIIYNVKSTIDNPQTALVAPKGKPIRSIKDLNRKGVRIGFLKDTRQMDMLRYILESEKFKTENYTLMAFTREELLDTMTYKIVDAILVTEPYRTYLIQKNMVNMIEDGILEKRIMSPLFVGVGYTSKVNVQLNKDGVARLVQAINNSIDFIRKEPQKSLEILAKNIGMENLAGANIPTFEKYSEITDVGEITKTVKKYIELQLMFREADFANSILKKEELQ